MKIKSETKESVKINVKACVIGAASAAASICATSIALKAVKRFPATTAMVTSVATLYATEKYLSKILFTEEEKSQLSEEKEISMLKEERERLKSQIESLMKEENAEQ